MLFRMQHFRRLDWTWPVVGLLSGALVLSAWVAWGPGVDGKHAGTLRGVVLTVVLTGAAWGMIERERAESRRVRTRHDAFVETSQEALIVCSTAGAILYANPAACRMFGYVTLLGVATEALMPESFRAKHRNAILRYLRTGETRIAGKRRSIVGLRANGAQFPCSIVVTFVGAWPDVQLYSAIHEEPEITAVADALAREGVIPGVANGPGDLG